MNSVNKILKMKAYLQGILLIGLFLFVACNNGKSKPSDTLNATKDTAQNLTVADSSVKTVSPVFAQLSPKVSALIGNITDQYLLLKNALAGDNHDQAVTAAKALSNVLNKADKSGFTADEKKVYEQQEDNLKEDAEHIGNTPEIVHQRYHFITLSEGVYVLAKNFGYGGKTLYSDHCPMANDKKGADWISEISGIKNPYLGTQMPTCGSVQEKIK